MTTAADILARLDLSPAEGAAPFQVAVGPVSVRVMCPGALRGELMAYFADALTDAPAPDAVAVLLLPDQTLEPEPVWDDWQREVGKAGRKDAVCDIEGARLIRKVRSGVTFLQSPDLAVAFGPLSENVSTVINFINTQILSVCLRDGWQLAHAAAVTRGGRTLAISGLSGGGKSTSILRMMDIEGAQFLSNDRVLVRGGTPAQALGIPKHPRINPGTILGNPRLHGMLPPEKHAALQAMPPADLWSLEEKHDLIIPDVYGPGRMCFAAPLTDFWVLNWAHDADSPTAVNEVNLPDRPDLLSAIVKSPGPFYQYPEGHFEPNGATLNTAPYLDALDGVRVCEVTGRIDFDVLAEVGRQLFDG